MKKLRVVEILFCYLHCSLLCRFLTYFPQGDLQNQTLQYAGWSESGNALVCIFKSNQIYLTIQIKQT